MVHRFTGKVLYGTSSCTKWLPYAPMEDPNDAYRNIELRAEVRNTKRYHLWYIISYL